MYNVSATYHTRIVRGEVPNSYVLIASDMGNRIYSNRKLSGFFETMVYGNNGTATSGTLKDGAGNLFVIEISDNLISKGNLRKTLQAKTRDVINSLTNKERQNIQIELLNYRYSITRNLATDHFLTKKLYVYNVFENDPIDDQLLMFTGRITEIEVDSNNITITAEEL